MYYGGGMSSEGHAAGEGEYGYASAYDEGAYGGGADPYAQQQQYYAQQQQQLQAPYGQPGEIMQYPGQTTYPPQQQQQQPQQLYPASPTNSGGIPYHQQHQSMGSDGAGGASSYEPQEHLRGPSPPAALVPGAVSSPAPSHRSIPQLGAMQFEQPQPPMPMPGSGSSEYGGQQPLRVVNDGGEDPYGGMDDAGGNAYHYQQQQQYYGQH
jgi:hypothetical protein